ncbi:4Fe-4S binding protein [Mariprofundus sp. EBB-1]|uniref:4Fe-4S binding protein n=1 Tax=Mariprofundus sp. EBB-1 TaxID=2650971 RepID=UPI001F37BF79|nr:4Fe-4S binding protein [Mariprofundus sp. EBB-1]
MKDTPTDTASEALKQIPIQVEHVAGAKTLRPSRRLLQYLTLIILILIPLSGLFRIDLGSASFILLERQVWFSDFLIIFGLWIFIASLLMMTYSLVGSAFCGWMCPQNTAAEFADMLTAKLLGRSANMLDISGEQMQVARRKKSWLNYLVLSIGLLLPAMLYALIPLLYFASPSQIWSYITLSEEALQNGSLYWIFLILTGVFLYDIAAVKHLWCKYMCFYRVWQESFKSKHSLRIRYDDQRSDHCLTCNYCVDACVLDLDPRTTGYIDNCINCGACVTACDELNSKRKNGAEAGLLSFIIGDKKTPSTIAKVLSVFLNNTKKPLLATVVGAVLLAMGMAGYQSESFSVSAMAENSKGAVLDYRINIAHKLYSPVNITLKVKGLNNSFLLDKDNISFETAGRIDVSLHVSPDLPSGLHRFVVLASADNGWSDQFEVTHFVKNSAIKSPSDL